MGSLNDRLGKKNVFTFKIESFERGKLGVVKKLVVGNEL